MNGQNWQPEIVQLTHIPSAGQSIRELEIPSLILNTQPH